MKHRKAIFAFGAARGMNTYLYAPKDDPYHRKRWRVPYPRKEWRELQQLIRAAQRHRIDFVYGFHPGEGLCFSAGEPVRILLKKAQRFYDVGVRTFAVLFDDIPSRLTHAKDRSHFQSSLARAEGEWLCGRWDDRESHRCSGRTVAPRRGCNRGRNPAAAHRHRPGRLPDATLWAI